MCICSKYDECMFVSVGIHAMAHVWRSDVNLMQVSIFFLV